MKRLMWSAVAVLAALPALAGDEDQRVFFFQAIKPGHGPDEVPIDHVKVLGAEEGFELKTVKGAPYQAEAITEIVQTLADGNRITRKTTASVARDSEGRVRRESHLAGLGPLPADDGPNLVFVHDPVAKSAFVLRADEKIARRMAHPRDDADEAVAPEPGPGKGMERMRRHEKPFPEGKSEDLGTETIEGVEAQGSRMTHTIPAGEIGNERPLQMVRERWYSPELQAVVMSRSVDPRLGETTYRLTNIQRGEPSHSLFEIPADYEVVEGGTHNFQKRIRSNVE
jgi:hypothetical protein